MFTHIACLAGVENNPIASTRNWATSNHSRLPLKMIET